MFINYLKYKLSNDFYEIIKKLQDEINNMNYSVSAYWTESFTKSIILFESQSKGHCDKCQNIIDVNKLYNGFLEKYALKLPIITVNELVIITNIKGKKVIGLQLSGSQFIDMRIELADSFGYTYYIDNDVLVKNFKTTDNKDNYIIEPLYVFLPIISESYIKKNINIHTVYLTLLKTLNILDVYQKEFQTINLVYETENKRGRKIVLW